MTLLQFMSDSPYLTFFLALIVGEVIVNTARAFGRCKCKREG